MSALEIIKKNAERLLNDAILLKDAGRWQSATALSILAVEEAGKYFLLKWRGVGAKGSFKHAAKQQVVGSFYHADAAMEAVARYLNEHGLEIQNVEDLSGWQSKFLGTPEGQKISDLLSTENDELVQLVATEMMNHAHGDFSWKAHVGTIDQIKKKALYVDLDVEGEIANDPTEISEAMAREWINHAETALRRIKKE